MSLRRSLQIILHHKAGRVLIVIGAILSLVCLGLLVDNISKRQQIVELLNSQVDTAPYVHVMSAAYSLNDVARCLNNAENALTSLGYIDQRIRQHNNKEPFGWVYGDKEDGSVSATIMCNMTDEKAITGFAVGGMDSNKTLEAVRLFANAKW